MAVKTVNEIVIDYLLNDTDMGTTFAEVYYLLNDSTGTTKIKSNYAIIYLIDDPKDVVELCPTDRGQARFQCEVYENTYDVAINNRQTFQTVMKALRATAIDSFTVDYIKILNVSDNSDRTIGQFNMNFECIVNWRQS